jgi:hypothetical protein
VACSGEGVSGINPVVVAANGKRRKGERTALTLARPKYFEDDRKGVPPERRPFITALAELIVADLLRRPPRKGEEK